MSELDLGTIKETLSRVQILQEELEKADHHAVRQYLREKLIELVGDTGVQFGADAGSVKYGVMSSSVSYIREHTPSYPHLDNLDMLADLDDALKRQRWGGDTDRVVIDKLRVFLRLFLGNPPSVV